jgi:hypothetical protein
MTNTHNLLKEQLEKNINVENKEKEKEISKKITKHKIPFIDKFCVINQGIDKKIMNVPTLIITGINIKVYEIVYGCEDYLNFKIMDTNQVYTLHTQKEIKRSRNVKPILTSQLITTAKDLLSHIMNNLLSENIWMEDKFKMSVNNSLWEFGRCLYDPDYFSNVGLSRMYCEFCNSKICIRTHLSEYTCNLIKHTKSMLAMSEFQKNVFLTFLTAIQGNSTCKFGDYTEVTCEQLHAEIPEDIIKYALTITLEKY